MRSVPQALHLLTLSTVSIFFSGCGRSNADPQAGAVQHPKVPFSASPVFKATFASVALLWNGNEAWNFDEETYQRAVDQVSKIEELMVAETSMDANHLKVTTTYLDIANQRLRIWRQSIDASKGFTAKNISYEKLQGIIDRNKQAMTMLDEKFDIWADDFAAVARQGGEIFATP